MVCRPKKPSFIPDGTLQSSRPLEQPPMEPPYPFSPLENETLARRMTSQAPKEPSADGFVNVASEDLHRSSGSDDDAGIDTGSEWDSGEDEENRQHLGASTPSNPVAGLVLEPKNAGDDLPPALRVGPPVRLPPISQEQQNSPGTRKDTATPSLEDVSKVTHTAQLQSQNPYLRWQISYPSSGSTEHKDPATDFARSSASISADAMSGKLQSSSTTTIVAPVELPSTKTAGDRSFHLELLDEEDSQAPPGIEHGPDIYVTSPTSAGTAPALPKKSEKRASIGWGSPKSVSDHDIILATSEPEAASGQVNEYDNKNPQGVQDTIKPDLRDEDPKSSLDPNKPEYRSQEGFGESALPLPPRCSAEEAAPLKPPRPPNMGGSGTDKAQVSLESSLRQQRAETYQIKHIRWQDPSPSSRNFRSSPILVQNANGPCPLLALVNALTLTTPSETPTALVETLRTRDQVSLGLLLDAVFDELTSSRRGSPAQELPDVGELYSFLITLHKGMNVNPRMVAKPAQPVDLMDDPREPGSGMHPAYRDRSRIGVFEETKEMRLYSTFGISLVHGWLPPEGSPAFVAFQRSAPTFEDAQNIQFTEAELEHKLQSQGLTSQEQQLFEDVTTIKQFLFQWPTQLTPYGLRVIGESLKPGEIAILFRNDHFSTLYKEPRSHQVLILVTDAGYASHEEVVWESLVDVSGRGSELLSGDLKPVTQSAPPGSSGLSVSSQQANGRPVRSLLDVDDDVGWTTVPRRRVTKSSNSPTMSAEASSSSSPHINGPAMSNSTDSGSVPKPITQGSVKNMTTSAATDPLVQTHSEQEDADLALALQLQEEEEHRHRQAEAQRRRENSLSAEFLEHDFGAVRQRRQGASTQAQTGRRLPSGQDIRPLVPPRRSGLAAGSGTMDIGNTEERLPTYGEAANRPKYVPPSSHPSSSPSSAPAASRNSLLGDPTASSASVNSVAAFDQNVRGRGRRGRPEFSIPHGRQGANPLGRGTAPSRTTQATGYVGPGRPYQANVDRHEGCVLM